MLSGLWDNEMVARVPEHMEQNDPLPSAGHEEDS